MKSSSIVMRIRYLLFAIVVLNRTYIFNSVLTKSSLEKNIVYKATNHAEPISVYLRACLKSRIST